jgi:polysaccharide biosynthesis/export protein
MSVRRRVRVTRRTPAGRLAALLALALFTAGCGSSGSFIWYRNLPKSEWGETSGEYIIGVGDGLRIQVYEQEGLSALTKVRPDGRIALPFVGEIVAAGKHPMGFAKELEARLKVFFVTPRVIVNVDEMQPVVVSILGQVGKVGSLRLEPSTDLLQALALAGGPNEFADKSSIFVLRRYPEFRRIRFTYDALVENRGNAARFSLRTGDVVVVE